MTKSQFLTALSEKLSEELSRELVLSNLEYYEEYINGEIAKGRSEDSVMEELGDPYMIARTIIDTKTGEAFEGYTEDVYTETTDQDSVRQAAETVVKGKHGCLIAALVIILITVILIAVLGRVISFLWPVLAPVLIILLIVSVFKDKRR